ncbi:MAG: inositol monophosphatase family protein, partial [Planctomycetota bacterium]
MSLDNDLAKIEHALALARDVVSTFTSGRIKAELKAGGDPVTAADIELDKVLRQTLASGDDGWLSEETADDLIRLKKRRVWIVDPLDGTREFVEGIDEWCISV